MGQAQKSFDRDKIVQRLALALDGEIDLRFGQDGAIATLSFQITKQVETGRGIVAGL